MTGSSSPRLLRWLEKRVEQEKLFNWTAVRCVAKTQYRRVEQVAKRAHKEFAEGPLGPADGRKRGVASSELKSVANYTGAGPSGSGHLPVLRIPTNEHAKDHLPVLRSRSTPP